MSFFTSVSVSVPVERYHTPNVLMQSCWFRGRFGKSYMGGRSVAYCGPTATPGLCPKESDDIGKQNGRSIIIKRPVGIVDWRSQPRPQCSLGACCFSGNSTISTDWHRRRNPK